MKIPLRNICSGMIVDKDLFLKENVKLISSGTPLTEQHIARLKKYSVSHIEIRNSQHSSPLTEPSNTIIVPKQSRSSSSSSSSSSKSEQPLLNMLKNIPIFSGFNEEQFSFIIQNAFKTKHPAQSLLFNEREQGDTFLVILRGTIKIFIRNNKGKEKILSILKKGDSFGELSLIDGQPRSASAQTVEESELLRFPRSKFSELILANPELAQTIMIGLSQRLRKTNQQISDLVFQDARYRIVKNLILMTNQFGERRGNSLLVKMPLNRMELAQMAGVKKMELDEIICDLEAKSILVMRENSFEIDLKKLQ